MVLQFNCVYSVSHNLINDHTESNDFRTQFNHLRRIKTGNPQAETHLDLAVAAYADLISNMKL